MITTAPPPGSDPTAVLGRRIGAYAIDFLLMLLIMVPIGAWYFTSNAETDRSGRDICNIEDSRSGGINSTYCLRLGDETRYLTDSKANQFTFLVYGAAFTAQVLNLVLLQGLTGASIGKHALGLRVVRTESGERAGFGWIVLRWLLLVVDALCCILPGIVLAASTKGHRRLGDMAAGTVVVGRDSVGHGPIAIPGLTAPPAGPAQSGGWAPPSSGSSPAGWAPPTSPPTSPSTPPPAGPAVTPGADAPTWDPARSAYIQFDRELGQWMQWDDTEGAWKPISQ